MRKESNRTRVSDKVIFSNGIDTNHVTFVNTVYTIFEKCIL